MAEEEDDDAVDEIAEELEQQEEEETLKEGVQNFEEDNGEFDSSFELDEDYDLDSAQYDIRETKEKVEELENRVDESISESERDKLKGKINSMAQSHELDQHIRQRQLEHRDHNALAMALGGGTMLMAYEINPTFIYGLVWPSLAYLSTKLSNAHAQDRNKVYKLIFNHFSYYIAAAGGVVVIQAAGGHSFPAADSLSNAIIAFMNAQLGI